jgi:hypothetical protein
MASLKSESHDGGHDERKDLGADCRVLRDAKRCRAAKDSAVSFKGGKI